MARKVYTVELDDKNIAGTKGSKASKVASNESEKEISAFGIVEINNNSAKGKVRNLKDVGFEKNVTGSEKKAVKYLIIFATSKNSSRRHDTVISFEYTLSFFCTAVPASSRHEITYASFVIVYRRFITTRTYIH